MHIVRTCLVPTDVFILSLHDALPISGRLLQQAGIVDRASWTAAALVVKEAVIVLDVDGRSGRSEEHTSELQTPYAVVSGRLHATIHQRPLAQCDVSRDGSRSARGTLC